METKKIVCNLCDVAECNNQSGILLCLCFEGKYSFLVLCTLCVKKWTISLHESRVALIVCFQSIDNQVYLKCQHCQYLAILCFNFNWLITARKRSLGQGKIFTPVCHSVHRGGGCLSACWDTTTRNPSRDHAPPAQSMLGDTVNTWAVRILLECNLVFLYFTRHISSSFFE